MVDCAWSPTVHCAEAHRQTPDLRDLRAHNNVPMCCLRGCNTSALHGRLGEWGGESAKLTAHGLSPYTAQWPAGIIPTYATSVLTTMCPCVVVEDAIKVC